MPPAPFAPHREAIANGSHIGVSDSIPHCPFTLFQHFPPDSTNPVKIVIVTAIFAVFCSVPAILLNFFPNLFICLSDTADPISLWPIKGNGGGLTRTTTISSRSRSDHQQQPFMEKRARLRFFIGLNTALAAAGCLILQAFGVAAMHLCSGEDESWGGWSILWLEWGIISGGAVVLATYATWRLLSKRRAISHRIKKGKRRATTPELEMMKRPETGNGSTLFGGGGGSHETVSTPSGRVDGVVEVDDIMPVPAPAGTPRLEAIHELDAEGDTKRDNHDNESVDPKEQGPPKAETSTHLTKNPATEDGGIFGHYRTGSHSSNRAKRIRTGSTGSKIWREGSLREAFHENTKEEEEEVMEERDSASAASTQNHTLTHRQGKDHESIERVDDRNNNEYTDTNTDQPYQPFRISWDNISWLEEEQEDHPASSLPTISASTSFTDKSASPPSLPSILNPTPQLPRLPLLIPPFPLLRPLRSLRRPCHHTLGLAPIKNLGSTVAEDEGGTKERNAHRHAALSSHPSSPSSSSSSSSAAAAAAAAGEGALPHAHHRPLPSLPSLPLPLFPPPPSFAPSQPSIRSSFPPSKLPPPPPSSSFSHSPPLPKRNLPPYSSRRLRPPRQSPKPMTVELESFTPELDPSVGVKDFAMG